MKRFPGVAMLFRTTAAFLIAAGTGRARADLVSQWLFDETRGTVAHDSVGGINGTLAGGATFDPGAGPGGGIYSGAIALNTAANGYVDMGNVYPFYQRRLLDRGLGESKRVGRELCRGRDEAS